LKVAIYARVSTTDQDVEPQLESLRKYAKERGWQIYKEYVDRGISGSKEKRPALNMLLDDAKKRKFEIVLVYKFDRFSRSLMHLMTNLQFFNVMGIDFISIMDNLDTTTPMGKGMYGVVAAFAEFERIMISEATKQRLQALKEKGIELGRPCIKVDTEEIHRLRGLGWGWRRISTEVGCSYQTVRRRALQIPLQMSERENRLKTPLAKNDVSVTEQLQTSEIGGEE